MHIACMIKLVFNVMCIDSVSIKCNGCTICKLPAIETIDYSYTCIKNALTLYHDKLKLKTFLMACNKRDTAFVDQL